MDSQIFSSPKNRFLYGINRSRQYGYGKENRVPLVFDENQNPKIIFADPEDTIYLADMSGDGLMDILRVRNGDVCYWPNIGYGNFGAKVRMC